MDNNPLIASDVVKIAVVGEPGCGKTTLINAFYTKLATGSVFSIGPAEVYPCRFRPIIDIRKAAIFEFPGYLHIKDLMEAFEECRINGIVLMYSVNDPLSFEMLEDKYIPALNLFKMEGFSRLPVVLVGNKCNLRGDILVMDRLGRKNRVPVTYTDGQKLLETYELHKFFECGSDKLMRDIVGFTLCRAFDLMDFPKE